MPDLTRKDADLIGAICDRALAFTGFKSKRLDLFMDLDYANQDIQMDLQKLLDFDDGNFMHDVTGIVCNFNRQTYTMDNFFVPRCSISQ